MTGLESRASAGVGAANVKFRLRCVPEKLHRGIVETIVLQTFVPKQSQSFLAVVPPTPRVTRQWPDNERGASKCLQMCVERGL